MIQLTLVSDAHAPFARPPVPYAKLTTSSANDSFSLRISIDQFPIITPVPGLQTSSPQPRSCNYAHR